MKLTILITGKKTNMLTIVNIQVEKIKTLQPPVFELFTTAQLKLVRMWI